MAESRPKDVAETTVAICPAAASAGTAPSGADPHRGYPLPAETPTQKGPDEIRFDFNEGARIRLPSRTTGQWRASLRDLDTGNILFESKNQGAIVRSSKRFYVRFGIDVWNVLPDGNEVLVLTHQYDAHDRDVLIQFPLGTLGDILAWFPYAARFRQINGCRLTCAMSPLLIALLRDGYPEIRFVTHEDVAERGLAESAYCLGLFFDDPDYVFQPTDFRQVGLHRTAGYILGVDPAEEAPKVVLPDETRPIDNPYVCIAVQSSTQGKYWNNRSAGML
jgi:autotransporter strand-loop-strand O-heptosyltransferase